MYFLEKKKTLPAIKVTIILKLILTLSRIKVKEKGMLDNLKSSKSIITVPEIEKNKYLIKNIKKE